MNRLAKIHGLKDQLVHVERDLIKITMGERDASDSEDMVLLEKARMAVSESLVQIDVFFESRTASRWGKP